MRSTHSMIGLILAGGEATRIGGGDKGLLQVGGRTILARTIATLRDQCDDVLISANGDPARLAPFGCRIVADASPDRRGPLAGILAGLEAIAASHPEADAAVSVPTDTPLLPDDLVQRLVAVRKATGAAIVCARSGGNPNPVVALWTVALRADLRLALDDGLRKVRLFFDRHPFAYADWSAAPHDPLFNVNTRADLAFADHIARACEAEGHPLADLPRRRL